MERKNVERNLADIYLYKNNFCQEIFWCFQLNFGNSNQASTAKEYIIYIYTVHAFLGITYVGIAVVGNEVGGQLSPGLRTGIAVGIDVGENVFM